MEQFQSSVPPACISSQPLGLKNFLRLQYASTATGSQLPPHVSPSPNIIFETGFHHVMHDGTQHQVQSSSASEYLPGSFSTTQVPSAPMPTISPALLCAVERTIGTKVEDESCLLNASCRVSQPGLPQMSAIVNNLQNVDSSHRGSLIDFASCSNAGVQTSNDGSVIPNESVSPTFSRPHSGQNSGEPEAVGQVHFQLDSTISDDLEESSMMGTGQMDTTSSLNLPFDAALDRTVSPPRGRGRPPGSGSAVGSSEEYKHTCTECGKGFQNNSALLKHQLIHSDERKFVCLVCNKGFKRQDHLTGHYNVHKAVKPFPCVFNDCDKSYCDGRSLRRHLEQSHSLLKPVVSSSKGYVKVVCQNGQSFTRKMNHSSEVLLVPTSESPQATDANDGSQMVDVKTFSESKKSGSVLIESHSLPVLTPSLSAKDIVGSDVSKSNQPELQSLPIVVQVQNKKTEGTAEGSVSCSYCGKCFKNVPSLNGHMRLHVAQKKEQLLAKSSGAHIGRGNENFSPQPSISVSQMQMCPSEGFSNSNTYTLSKIQDGQMAQCMPRSQEPYGSLPPDQGSYHHPLSNHTSPNLSASDSFSNHGLMSPMAGANVYSGTPQDVYQAQQSAPRGSCSEDVVYSTGNDLLERLDEVVLSQSNVSPLPGAGPSTGASPYIGTDPCGDQSGAVVSSLFPETLEPSLLDKDSLEDDLLQKEMESFKLPSELSPLQPPDYARYPSAPFHQQDNQGPLVQGDSLLTSVQEQGVDSFNFCNEINAACSIGFGLHHDRKRHYTAPGAILNQPEHYVDGSFGNAMGGREQACPGWLPQPATTVSLPANDVQFAQMEPMPPIPQGAFPHYYGSASGTDANQGRYYNHHSGASTNYHHNHSNIMCANPGQEHLMNSGPLMERCHVQRCSQRSNQGSSGQEPPLQFTYWQSSGSAPFSQMNIVTETPGRTDGIMPQQQQESRGPGKRRKRCKSKPVANDVIGVPPKLCTNNQYPELPSACSNVTDYCPDNARRTMFSLPVSPVRYFSGSGKTQHSACEYVNEDTCMSDTTPMVGSKELKRPSPLPLSHLMQGLSKSLHIFRSQLRSPCLCPETCKTPPPYTPPPILSPLRQGSGLFWTINTKQNAPALSSNETHLSGIVGQVSGYKSAPISPKFGFRQPFWNHHNLPVTNASSTYNGASRVSITDASLLCNQQTTFDHPSFGNEAPLMLQVSSTQGSDSGSSEKPSPSTAVSPPELLIAPLQTDARPHINIGPSYQAEIPECIKSPELTSIVEKEDLLWDPTCLEEVSEEDLDNYLQFSCSDGVLGGGNNTEYALHLLHLAKGNIQEAIRLLMLPPNFPESHPLAAYDYLYSTPWSEDEIKLFVSALMEFDKDFRLIAHKVPEKSVKQCLVFYYLWKQLEPDEYRKVMDYQRQKRQETLSEQVFSSYNLRSSVAAANKDPQEQSEELLSGEQYSRDGVGGMEESGSRDPSLTNNDATSTCVTGSASQYHSPVMVMSNSAEQTGMPMESVEHEALNYGSSVFLKDQYDATGSGEAAGAVAFNDHGFPTVEKTRNSVKRSLISDANVGKNKGMMNHSPSAPLLSLAQSEFPCRICGKVFPKLKSRSAHMKIHSMKCDSGQSRR